MDLFLPSAPPGAPRGTSVPEMTLLLYATPIGSRLNNGYWSLRNIAIPSHHSTSSRLQSLDCPGPTLSLFSDHQMYQSGIVTFQTADSSLL